MVGLSELKKVDFTWGEAQHATKDRPQWRQMVDALYPTGDEEELIYR